MVAPGRWRDDGPATAHIELEPRLLDGEGEPPRRYRKCPEPGCELRHPDDRKSGCKMHGGQTWET